MAALLLPAAALASLVAAEGPCDILAAAGNPCVAAHSTVRVSTQLSRRDPRVPPATARARGPGVLPDAARCALLLQPSVLKRPSPCPQALFAKYDGPLYNVTKPDGTSKQIGLLSPGGFADKKAHDAFCDKLDCVISNVFDQSPMHNHLGQRHKLINASRHSITVGKDKTPVYAPSSPPLHSTVELLAERSILSPCIC
jgi:hypothetical protein